MRWTLAAVLLLACILPLDGCGARRSHRKGPEPEPAVTTDPRPVADGEEMAVEQEIPGAYIPVPPVIRDSVAATDRPAADRALDASRRPDQLLAFFGIERGMKVGELGAGEGYTAEILARVVGPSGVVYAQNSVRMLSRFGERPWRTRLEKPAMRNVVRVDREFENPFPAGTHDLDAVFLVNAYHETVLMGVDRERMHQAVYRALKPGGVYAVVDHSAWAGTGTSAAATLHRIEEDVVRREIEPVGFKLVAEGSFLRNPDDSRVWNASPEEAGSRRGTSDRFVLKFVKRGF